MSLMRRNPIMQALWPAIGSYFVMTGGDSGSISYLPSDLFKNGEQGAWYDFYDDMDTKIAFRRNLLTYSEDFTNAVWTKASVTATANVLDGMDKIVVAGNANELKQMVYSSSIFAGDTVSIDAKAAEYNYVSIVRHNWGGYWFGFVFNLATGTADVAINTGGADVVVPSIVDLGNGVYRCSVTWISLDPSAGVVPQLGIMPSITNDPIFGPTRVNAGDGVSGIYINRVQQDKGPATPYQKVTDWNTEFLAAFPNHALFQDSLGTTAVTNVEQPLGLVLDKSGNGNHLIQATAASRPVLSARKNWLLATDVLSTQSVTVLATQHVLSFTGTGTITLSGVSTAGPLVGTGASDRVSLTFTPTAGSLTLTVSGSVTLAQLERVA